MALSQQLPNVQLPPSMNRTSSQLMSRSHTPKYVSLILFSHEANQLKVIVDLDGDTS